MGGILFCKTEGYVFENRKGGGVYVKLIRFEGGVSEA